MRSADRRILVCYDGNLDLMSPQLFAAGLYVFTK